MTKPILTLPCKYTLNDFEQRGDLHHCQSCNHSLIDFRNATDEEIQSELTKNNSRSCGIFNASQVQAKSTTYQLGFKQRIGLSLLGILGFISPAVLTSCETPDLKEQSKEEKEEIAFSKLKFPLYLRGKLVDSQNQKPIIMVQVNVMQENKVLLSGTTDENGEFKIKLEKGYLSSAHFDLVMERFGYINDTLRSLDAKNKRVLNNLELSLEALPQSTTHFPDEGEIRFVKMEYMTTGLVSPYFRYHNEYSNLSHLDDYLKQEKK